MRGQVFTLDLLASLLIAVVMLSIFVAQTEQSYSRAQDSRYAYVQTLADDVAQMAVKNALSPTKTPNYLNQNMNPLENLVATMIAKPYDCEASVAASSMQCFSGCAGKSIVAVSQRPVYVQNPPQTSVLTVKVCV